jgi:hypothetical protein
MNLSTLQHEQAYQTEGDVVSDAIKINPFAVNPYPEMTLFVKGALARRTVGGDGEEPDPIARYTISLLALGQKAAEGLLYVHGMICPLCDSDHCDPVCKARMDALIDTVTECRKAGILPPITDEMPF